MKFKLHRGTMNVAGVRVRIYDEGKCIHEHETARSDKNDPGTLMQDLRDTQSAVNDFLTALIQRRDASGEMANLRSNSSDVESDSDDDDEDDEDEKEEEEEGETRSNPKKCKLST